MILKRAIAYPGDNEKYETVLVVGVYLPVKIVVAADSFAFITSFVVAPPRRTCRSYTLLAGMSSTEAIAPPRLFCSILELDSVVADRPDNVNVTDDVR